MTHLSKHDAAADGGHAAGAEVHLCDSYVHLLYAVADLTSRRDDSPARPLVLFIDDRLRLDDRLLTNLSALSGAEILRVSDDTAIDAFARLPTFLPPMLRRNLSFDARRAPIRPSGWSPPYLAGRRFDAGYVYHPGFFLSKVVAGHCRRVVMRDSGYANYVRHRVPWKRALPRLAAGRSPRFQTWGEEPWVHRIEVVRPDQLPDAVRHKATRLTLDQLMERLPASTARSLAAAFWDGPAPTSVESSPTALVLTQPVDELGICSLDDKIELYASIVARLHQRGLRIVVKPHPRERTPVLGHEAQIPASFPIEAWTWLGRPRFDVAIALNSTSLSDSDVSFANRRMQLIPPERFYPEHWASWPAFIDQAFAHWTIGEEAITEDGQPAAAPVSGAERRRMENNE